MLLKAMFNHPLGVAREMDRLFDSMMSSQPVGGSPTIRTQWPAINVWEDQEAFHAEAELPGLTLADIDVLVTEDEVTLRGTRRIEVPDEMRPLRRERAGGTFERTVSLPSPIDGERVEATLVDGVLSITLPKIAAVLPRRIEIKASSPGA